MINDFIEIISQSFKELCIEKHTVKLIKNNVAAVSFLNFSILIHYCAYEYDLELSYCKKEKTLCLNQVFQELGCSDIRLPKYKMMSNAEIMSNYLREYIALINQFYKELSDYKISS